MKSTWLRLLSMALILASGMARSVLSKDEPQPPVTKPNAPSLDAVLERLERVERELIQLKQSKGQQIDPQLAKVAVLTNNIHLDVQHTGAPDGLRVLSAKVTVLNLTDKAIEVPADLYTLTVNGAELKSGVPPTLTQRSFYDGHAMVNYANLRTVALKLAPGDSGQTVVVFAGLPGGAGVPKPMVLNVRGTTGQLARIDLLEQSAKQLGLQVERIGPRKALAVVTISGQLAGLASWALSSQLETLATDKVARVVVTFAETAPPPDANVFSWLQNSAMQSGINEYANNAFTPIPSAIAEFHVVVPASRRTPTSTSSARVNRIQVINGVPQQVVAPKGPGRHVHNMLDDAVSDALASIYQVLPRDELLEEILNGTPQTRVAALANGGGRLSTEDLPLILKLANDSSIETQKAALRALRHFGEDAAVTALVEQARKNSGAASDAAIESLAGSRFTKAHDALLELMKNEPKGSRKAIVQSLALFARPIWSDTLYGFVKDKDSGVRLDALTALSSIGHPKLVELLDESLNDKDKPLSEAAFGLLSHRDDAASEQIAVTWTLKHLQTAPPTLPMRDLLIRTKEHRAVPLLLKHLDKAGPARAMCLETLGQIGDQTVNDRFVAVFDKIDNNEKRIVLQALHRLQSPAFREVAEKALATTDYSLLSQAANLLQNDGTPQSAAILVTAFKQPGDDNRFGILCSALSVIANAEARAALYEAAKAQTTPNAYRTNVIKNAIQNLQLRSPARQFVMQGRALEEGKQLPLALAQYELAVKADPENPEARLARANLRLKQDQLEKAADDFTKLTELDPTNSQGPTGLGIILARQGKLEEAAKQVEDSREKFNRENLFLYNAACVYGRALEYVRDHKEIADRDEKLKTYERKAVDDIKAAINTGLDEHNRNWAKEDPDLKSLHQNDEFKKLLELK